MLVVDKKDLKRLMSEKKSIAAKNEKKIESRFAKYPFVYESGMPENRRTPQDSIERPQDT